MNIESARWNPPESRITSRSPIRSPAVPDQRDGRRLVVAEGLLDIPDVFRQWMTVLARPRPRDRTNIGAFWSAGS
jgi:hypothetical protein